MTNDMLIRKCAAKITFSYENGMNAYGNILGNNKK